MSENGLHLSDNVPGHKIFSLYKSDVLSGSGFNSLEHVALL